MYTNIGKPNKQIALATKCLKSNFIDTFRSPNNSQSWITVATPIMAIVNNPTHLQDTTAPSDKPVRDNQIHQGFVNGRVEFSLLNPTQKKIEVAVKKIKGESRRISLDWVISPFSNVMNKDERSAVIGRHANPRIVK